MIYSENIGLKIPQSTDYFTTSDFAENYVIIDNEVHELDLSILDLENDIEDVVDNSAPPIVATVQGEIITVSDSAERKLKGLSIFGKSAQNGTPTPDVPVEITSTSDSGSVTVTVSDGGENSQTITITTPNGLYGLSVASGGNYTDANGQKWIADEIDFERGVKIQRVKQIVLDGTETFSEPSTASVIGTNNNFFYTSLTNDAMGSGDNSTYGISICSHFPVGSVLTSNASIAHQIRLPSPTSKWRLSIRPKDVANMTLETFKAWLAEQYTAGTPVVIQYALATPIETPLTDEEITAYKTLKTNYPNTTITNDKGAGLKLSYIADTKNYIDNKFAELSAAVL